jgi:two-component system sensor histidine kinase TorS
MRTPSRDLPHSASLRLRALAALSGSLTDALAPDHAAELVEQRALSAIGATVKFTDHGAVVLLLRLQDHHADMRVIFEVTDSGRGIARVDHARIFEPFWQGDHGDG